MTTISDLYINLFGKGAIQDGTVIDMAEHGRTGGVSTGQPFKFVAIPSLAVQAATNASLTVTGFAKPGTLTSTANWKLMAEDVNGNVLWANGNDNYTNIFDNFNTISFS